MTVAQSPILAGLYTYLTTDSAFNTSLGGGVATAGRLWWGQAKPREDLPYAVMDLIDSNEELEAFDKDAITMRVQISVFSPEDDGPKACSDIVDNLIARLNGQRITATGHTMMRAELDITRGPFVDDQLWRMDADFLVMGHES